MIRFFLREISLFFCINNIVTPDNINNKTAEEIIEAFENSDIENISKLDQQLRLSLDKCNEVRLELLKKYKKEISSIISCGINSITSETYISKYPYRHMFKITEDKKGFCSFEQKPLVMVDLGSDILKINEFSGLSSIKFFYIDINLESKLLLAIENNQIFIWNIENGLLLKKLNQDNLAIDNAIFNPDGTYVASCAQNQKGISLWQTDTGLRIWFLLPEVILNYSINPINCSVRPMVFNLNGDLIAACKKNCIHKLNSKKNFEAEMIDLKTEHNILSPDGRYIVALNDKKLFSIWDIEDKKEVIVLEDCLNLAKANIDNLQFSANSKFLLAFSRNKKISNLYEINSGKKIIEFNEAFDYVQFSDNDKYLLTLNLNSKEKYTLWHIGEANFANNLNLTSLMFLIQIFYQSNKIEDLLNNLKFKFNYNCLDIKQLGNLKYKENIRRFLAKKILINFLSNKDLSEIIGQYFEYDYEGL